MKLLQSVDFTLQRILHNALATMFLLHEPLHVACSLY